MRAAVEIPRQYGLNSLVPNFAPVRSAPIITAFMEGDRLRTKSSTARLRGKGAYGTMCMNRRWLSCPSFGLRTASLFWITVWACCLPPAPAQLIFRGGLGPRFLVTPGASSIELTEAQIDTVASTIQTRLEHVPALVQDQQWDEVLDTLSQLMEVQNTGVVEVAAGRFMNLRDYCHLKIAQLPPAALDIYRSRVDTIAEAWFRQGVETRDQALLARVVDETFCSSWGDDALLALGELALEKADYAAARFHWQRISPALSSPGGQPPWIALGGLDLRQHQAEINRIWNERRSSWDWLAYPDTDLSPAEVQARLALVAAREGNLQRAKWEASFLRLQHPQTTGQLGGKRQSLVSALDRILEGAAAWPNPVGSNGWHTFAGSFDRQGGAPRAPTVNLPAWNEPVSYYASSSKVRHTVTAGQRHPDRPLRCHPLVVDDLVLYNTLRKIQAADLATGEPAITSDGVLYQQEHPSADSAVIRPNATRVVVGVSHHTMTEYDGRIYARIGDAITSQTLDRRSRDAAPAGHALVGIDRHREGLLVFKVTPDDNSWSFEGAPVCNARNVFIAMRQNDVKPRAYVTCFDARSGQRCWRTQICSADTFASGRGAEITHGLLTLVGDTIFYNTNLGVVAALSADDGQIRWLRRYDRATKLPVDRLAGNVRREISPCVYDSGMVVVAPADTRLIFAIDATTGKPAWVTDKPDDVTHLLGIVHGAVVATGDRVWSLDLQTGRVNFVWPESTMAGIRGLGRGVIAGSEILWPTRDQIYRLDALTGAQTRAPIDLTHLDSEGANLVVAGGILLLAGPDDLNALGPRRQEQNGPAEGNSETGNSPLTGQVEQTFAPDNSAVVQQSNFPEKFKLVLPHNRRLTTNTPKLSSFGPPGQRTDAVH